MNQVIEWAKELQSLAQAGLYYGRDDFDKERYQRIREISAEMMAAQTGLSAEMVQDLFCGDSGYQTPKVDTRAAIVENGKILLVRERNGRWALPGGWCDYELTPAENTVKEAREEAGLDVVIDRLIAVQDRDRHNKPAYAYKIVIIFFLVHRVGGSFARNIETSESGFFSLDALPPLAEEKCTRDQVEMCLKASQDPDWAVQYE